MGGAEHDNARASTTMARPDGEEGYLPSLLDRLIDPSASGTAWRRGYGVEQMVSAVQRDLEDLLNSHKTCEPFSDEFAEVARSIYAYGLPDLPSQGDLSSEQREKLGQLIAEVISKFEPRLRDIHVHLLEDDDQTGRTVRFHVDARLNVDPAPDVDFDTVLELTTGQYSIRPSGG
jgi:type VI secretion system protein ImpF